jgi:predicted DsbA family dithiol-disulfide isomerase
LDFAKYSSHWFCGGLWMAGKFIYTRSVSATYILYWMKDKLLIKVFTDPTCPFAYSAEPSRWRIKWLYGGQIKWETKMIVLYETEEDLKKKNFTPAMQAKKLRQLQEKYGMPFNTEERSRLAIPFLACKAYIAVKHNQSELAERFLRKLRIASMSGTMIDKAEIIIDIAGKIGIPPANLKTWMSQEVAETHLREDMAQARQPSQVALAMKNKLAANDGGYRYSAPTYQFIKKDSVVFELPGFWPTTTYEAVIPNIAPELVGQANPNSVTQVLEWANESLSTVEVAALTSGSIDETRQSLRKVAILDALGEDGFWSLK